MPTEANITPVPFHDPSPWHSYLEHGLFTALFASAEGDETRRRIRERDRILIIEDDLLIATQIQTTLTEAGFDIIGIATTGEEAIEVASKDLPDLAVVDVRLAGDRDGVDTALELFRLHGIRCIFASAYSNHETRQRAEPAAPLGWLQKPYGMVSLTDLVRAATNEVRGKGGQ
jgi:two-component system, response regulator PdtaR